MENLITYGADPEFFVEITYKHKKTDNIITSIEPSSLFFPDECDDENNNVHNDGYQAELQVKYSNTIDEMKSNIKEGLTIAMNRLQKYADNTNITDFKFLCLPAINVTKHSLEKGGRVCQIFGCKPDYNIYNESATKVNHCMVNGETHLVRYSGGHIHAGEKILTKDQLDSEMFLRLCDKIIGNTMVWLDTRKSNQLRSKFYGKAGTYRSPDYGVEYRTLSSYWLSHPKLTELVFQLMDICTMVVYENKDQELLRHLNTKLFRMAIDNYDTIEAKINLIDILSELDRLKIKTDVYKGQKSFMTYLTKIKNMKMHSNILHNWKLQ